MSKKIITIIIIIMIAALGYWVYQSTITPEPEELTKKGQACVNSGGEVSTSLCCETTGDFPNLCSIGPCACAPEYSHKVKICDCGSDKCFNGSGCVFLDEISKDEVSVLLENLKQETEIDFSDIQPLEFKWVVKVDPKVEEADVEGKGFEARGIPAEQELKVTEFLTNDGFEKDLYNMADGTVVGLMGYKKDRIVCTVTSGASGYKEATGQWVPPNWDEKDIDIKCGKLEIIIDPAADWNSYTSEKYGYSFKYPTDCLYGPLPGYCKQKPPEERPRECRCYLNGENPDSVSLGTFTGTKSDLTGASFVISHYSTDPYNPPVGTELVGWLKEKFSYQEIPDEINMELDGISAVRVYTPQSPMAFSQEDIYFIKNDKLFSISILDVDNKDNRELYDKILATFRF